MPNKWNVLKVMMIGVICSPIMLIGSSLLRGEAIPTQPAELVGLIIGGMVGGALLFGIVALIRNAFVR